MTYSGGKIYLKWWYYNGLLQKTVSSHDPTIVIGQEADPPVRSYVTKISPHPLLVTPFPQSIITNPFVGIPYNHATEDFHFLLLFFLSCSHLLV
jgi:hypothetical protein